MRSEKKPFVWPSEAALCAEFVSTLPDGWVSYNETCGFDMVLVHQATGTQIAVEAKLTLNTKVLMQAVARRWRCESGPDFRAVLVGKTNGELSILAAELAVTVITLRQKPARYRHWEWQGPEKPSFEIRPPLPEPEPIRIRHDAYAWMHRENWFDEAPVKRLALPEYIPDVDAGHPAPMMLSDWKIKAIKVCIYVERHRRINRATFKALGIDPSRWMTGRWLAQAVERGFWVAGPSFPGSTYRRCHPEVYARIEADYATWAAASKIEVEETQA